MAATTEPTTPPTTRPTTPPTTRPTSRQQSVLVVGTSPFSLAMALLKQRAGADVTIAERASEPGGAWVTDDIDGLSGVDRGCHLLEANNAVYEWIERELELELQPLQYQPRIHLGRWSLGMGTRLETLLQLLMLPAFAVHSALRVVTAGDRGAAIERGRTETRFRAQRLMRRVRNGGLRRRQIYRDFALGTHDAIEQLVESFGRNGGQVLFDTTVSQIRTRPDGRCEARLGDTNRCFDEIVLPAGVHSCSIDAGPRTVELADNTFENHHVLMKLDTTVDHLSYRHILHDPIIRRVSTVDRSGTGTRHLLVQLRGDATAAEITNRLIAHGLISDVCRGEVVKAFDYQSHDTRAAPGQLHPAITLFASHGDLVYNLERFAMAAVAALPQ